MPNIEIHGFSPHFSPPLGALPGFPAEVYAIVSKIESVLKELELGSDAIVDVLHSVAASCDGKKTKMPYLRVCDTDLDRMQQIVQALKEANIGMDVETLLLSGFIEAKDMKA